MLFHRGQGLDVFTDSRQLFTMTEIERFLSFKATADGFSLILGQASLPVLPRHVARFTICGETGDMNPLQTIANALLDVSGS